MRVKKYVIAVKAPYIELSKPNKPLDNRKYQLLVGPNKGE
jgi:hypothetical protein